MGPDPIVRRDPVDTGRTYLCIDLKSFYASVECVDRGLDPFKDNLVVADPRHQGARGALPLSRVRDSQAHPLHHGAAAHEALHGGISPDLRYLPAAH